MAPCLLLVAAAAAGSSAPPPSPPMNFIFYQPDEMRAESLGCYGHPTSKTPAFDAFAKQGTRFEQAHVSYTVCTQSRVSFMTGWPTHVRGHRSLWSLLHDNEPNLLKYLKGAGYTVKWWGKNDLLAHDAWNSSVTSARQSGGGNVGPNAFKMGEPGYYSFLSQPFAGRANETSDAQNVAAAIDFLTAAPPPEPFMIFLPLTLPHPPYSAPEPFYSSIDPSTLPPLRAAGAPRKPNYHALIRQHRNLTSLGEPFWRKLHATYLGAISYSDFLFGLLTAALEAASNRLAQRTSVFVFADHGDYAGDYGLVEKWSSGLEDVLTRVPLLARVPGGAAAHVVSEPVQLFDIVPTVLELANIASTHIHFGKSLVEQIVRGRKGERDAVFSEGGFSNTTDWRDLEGSSVHGGLGPKEGIYSPKLAQEQEQPLSTCRAASVRTLSHKLVLRSDPSVDASTDLGNELYDLAADPREETNVYGEPAYAAAQAELEKRLLRWYLETADVTPWAIDPRDGGYPWPPKRGGQEMHVPLGVDGPLGSTGLSADEAIGDAASRLKLGEDEAYV